MVFELKEGLDIPISGKPVQDIQPGPAITSVGLLGDDYIGMRPTMLVNVGDQVKLGQPVFSDKKNEGVIYVAPGAGTVKAINRGAKRKFDSLEIELAGDEEVTFQQFDNVDELEREQVQSQLVDAGMWNAFRTRPYSKVPQLNTDPNSIFVTAMDTNPLSAEPELIISSNKELFTTGLHIVSKLTQGKTFVCTRPDSRIPGEEIPDVVMEEFQGPHPAGLAGTHIHFLDPVSPNKTVWTIGYQDVIAIGYLFTTGRIMTERVVAVGGPVVAKPGLLKSRLGACLDDFFADGATDLNNARVISGSPLCGRKSVPTKNYLGRYHNQISVVGEGNQREFLGWQMPGFDKFSITKIYGGSWLKDKLFPLTTSTGGSKRAMVPVGTYECVMPLDMLPTPLLRALISGETEDSQMLGALELDEEDLALCTYVCPGKYDYGSILRENLTLIEKEG
jgi:Na+-transporting NADH:ubiquinone oxidoreductase subunit A